MAPSSHMLAALHEYLCRSSACIRRFTHCCFLEWCAQFPQTREEIKETGKEGKRFECFSIVEGAIKGNIFRNGCVCTDGKVMMEDILTRKIKRLSCQVMVPSGFSCEYSVQFEINLIIESLSTSWHVAWCGVLRGSSHSLEWRVNGVYGVYGVHLQKQIKAILKMNKPTPVWFILVGLDHRLYLDNLRAPLQWSQNICITPWWLAAV